MGEDRESEAGTLFVVSTPIGNLGDVTARALETLRAVHRIAAEDTRRTRALLSHFEIRGKKLVSLDAHATAGAVEGVVQSLVDGDDVALVTDAGTPGVSDPGAHLVRAAAARKCRVVTVPGASALTAAVSVSGLVDGPFLFLGFLPRRGRKRTDWLDRIERTAEPVVLFESPNRAAATLRELAERMPSRDATVSRELSKRFEETVRGSLAEIATHAEWRGEIAIVLGQAQPVEEAVTDEEVDRHIEAMLDDGAKTKAIASEVAERTGRSKRAVYERARLLRDRR